MTALLAALACAPASLDAEARDPLTSILEESLQRDAGQAPSPWSVAPDAAPLHVDVLVVGAGPAGLAAAIEAERAGATVRVLEREDEVGGAAAWAGGLMMFSGTQRQADYDVEDSPEQLLAEWSDITGGDPADPWVRAFAERNVPDVYDWLYDMGVRFGRPQLQSSAGTTTRIHGVVGEGPELVEMLHGQLSSRRIRMRTQADALLTDRTGRVIGVRWTELESGDTGRTLADAVVVATGGFGRDLERVRAERPDLASVDLRYASFSGADGHGLTMLEGLGAATQNLGAVGLYAHGIESGNGEDEYITPLVRGSPWFNADGARFVDETRTNAFPTGDAVASQPAGGAWAFFDGAALSSTEFRNNDPERPPLPPAEVLDEGTLIASDTLAGLATALGMPSATVEDAMGRYDAFASGASSTDDVRTSTEGARTLVAPPYYAAPVAVAVAKMFGGIDVDLDGRVLDTDGAVIPGVYAAGELTGMAGGSLVGGSGFTGSLTAVVLSGRVAGAAAAAEGLARDRAAPVERTR